MMSERTELLELIADTKAYLLFLKETGVEEVFAKSKEEARSKKQEVRNTIASETSMSVLLTKDDENKAPSPGPSPARGEGAKFLSPPP